MDVIRTNLAEKNSKLSKLIEEVKKLLTNYMNNTSDESILNDIMEKLGKNSKESKISKGRYS